MINVKMLLRTITPFLRDRSELSVLLIMMWISPLIPESLTIFKFLTPNPLKCSCLLCTTCAFTCHSQCSLGVSWVRRGASSWAEHEHKWCFHSTPLSTISILAQAFISMDAAFGLILGLCDCMYSSVHTLFTHSEGCCDLKIPPKFSSIPLSVVFPPSCLFLGPLLIFIFFSYFAQIFLHFGFSWSSICVLTIPYKFISSPTPSFNLLRSEASLKDL